MVLANMDKIGKHGSVELGGLTVEVKILDVKSTYGQDRFQITPLAGSGNVWVSADRVVITEGKE